MLRRTRAFVLLALAAVLLAGPAFANGKHWRKHHKHHHRHHHGCGHGGHGGHWAPRYVEHHYARPYPVYHHGYGGPAYCGPCGHSFDSYDHLSYHVHRHHHVAAIHLPFVLFEASIGGGGGWVYED